RLAWQLKSHCFFYNFRGPLLPPRNFKMALHLRLKSRVFISAGDEPLQIIGCRRLHCMGSPNHAIRSSFLLLAMVPTILLVAVIVLNRLSPAARFPASNRGWLRGRSVSIKLGTQPAGLNVLAAWSGQFPDHRRFRPRCVGRYRLPSLSAPRHLCPQRSLP